MEDTPHARLQRQIEILEWVADNCVDAIADIKAMRERPADWGDVGKHAKISDYARGFKTAMTEM